MVAPGAPSASASPQPSSPAPPQHPSWAREPTVPTRTGPCLAAHLRDGHLRPVSPPPVPMLCPHLGWGAASTYWLEDTLPNLSLSLSGVLCPICLSTCLYSSRRSILPHIKPPSSPLRPPSSLLLCSRHTVVSLASAQTAAARGGEPRGGAGRSCALGC